MHGQYLTHDGQLCDHDHPDVYCRFNPNQASAAQLRQRLRRRPAPRMTLSTPEPVRGSLAALLGAVATSDAPSRRPQNPAPGGTRQRAA